MSTARDSAAAVLEADRASDVTEHLSTDILRDGEAAAAADAAGSSGKGGAPSSSSPPPKKPSKKSKKLGSSAAAKKRYGATSGAHAPKPSSTGPDAENDNGCGAPPSWLLPTLLLAGGASLTVLAVRKLLRRLGSVGDSAIQVSVDVAAALLKELHVAGPPLGPGSPPQPLASLKLVLSDVFDVEGEVTGYGSDAWAQGHGAAGSNAAAVDLLLSAGMVCVAKARTAPCNMVSMQVPAMPNPAAPARATAGGSHGAAAALAGGTADLALAVDELGAARLPAAACGVYCLRPTRGCVALEGAQFAARTVSVVSVLAAEAQVLARAGVALQLPGGGLSNQELARVIIAEDLFAEAGIEPRALAAARRACVKWAGPGQVGIAELGGFIAQGVPSLAKFGEKGSTLLDRCRDAARAVVWHECGLLHGEWLAEQQQQGQGDEGLSSCAQQATEVSAERYAAARDVMKEMYSAFCAALSNGTLLLLPTAAGPPPPAPGGRGSGSGGEAAAAAAAAAAADWAARSEGLCAVATLMGAPAVAMPLRTPSAAAPGGGMLSSLTLLGLHKTDQRLLAAAAKLGPGLQAAADSLAAEEVEAEAAAKATAKAKKGGEKGGTKAQGAQAKAQAKEAAARAEEAAKAEAAQEQADKHKAAGNEALKAKAYDVAIREYSAAIELAPGSSVYHSNRALAYLKVMQFEQAKADCDSALAIELSAKALLRRGTARLGLNDLDGAEADFRQVTALEPNNRQAREELRGLRHMRRMLEGAEDGTAGLVAPMNGGVP